MSRVEFALVDVFAVAPLTGNALAVVPDADGLDVPTMRAVAREFNQSETTFLCAPDLPGATWRLRSFTAAGHEVGGAGHNALGAWLGLRPTLVVAAVGGVLSVLWLIPSPIPAVRSLADLEPPDHHAPARAG